MKKGQVTLFVIIGIIILLAASLFFYLNYTFNEDQPGVDVVDVSLETRPMFQLVEGGNFDSTVSGLSYGPWKNHHYTSNR